MNVDDLKKFNNKLKEIRLIEIIDKDIVIELSKLKITMCDIFAMIKTNKIPLIIRDYEPRKSS